jgi:hypothetical protein
LCYISDNAERFTAFKVNGISEGASDNFFSASTHSQLRMALITIPFDYEQREDRDQIVPICVNDVDDNGRKVAWGWIEAVVPIADRAVGIARRVLDDPFRVSELVEPSVHSLSRRHGENYGDQPQYRILRNVKWRAMDERFGHWRVRKGYDVPLGNLEFTLRAKSDHAEEYARREILDQVRNDFIKYGYEDMPEIMDMLLHGCMWDQVVEWKGLEVTDRSVNTIQRWFWRVFEKVTQGR